MRSIYRQLWRLLHSENRKIAQAILFPESKAPSVRRGVPFFATQRVPNARDPADGYLTTFSADARIPHPFAIKAAKEWGTHVSGIKEIYRAV